jgi:hypothetical protein
MKNYKFFFGRIHPRRMSAKNKLFWNARALKSIYCTIGVIGGIYVRLFETVGPQSIKAKTVISNMLVLGHLAFFLFECINQVFYDIKLKTFRTDLQTHHMLSLVSFLTFKPLTNFFVLREKLIYRLST